MAMNVLAAAATVGLLTMLAPFDLCLFLCPFV
jgi:hypothetical protein